MSRARPARVWTRQLGERERQRAFAITAALLMLAAVALTLAARPAPEPHPTPAAAQPPIAPVAPSTTATITPAPPDRARALARAAGRRRAVRVARAFLAGYLPYLYGRRPARAIDGATLALRRQLARERPRRLGRDARSRRPRVVTLAAHGDDRWQVRARIADGAHTYTVVLLVAVRDGRPAVAQIGGA